jgi:hypothetical protein
MAIMNEMMKIAAISSQYSGNKSGNNRNKVELINNIIKFIIKILVILNPNLICELSSILSLVYLKFITLDPASINSQLYQ